MLRPHTPAANAPVGLRIRFATPRCRKLKSLPCEVFLAPDSGFFGLSEKARRLERGEKPNPFIEPAAYRDFIAKAEGKYLKQLEEERIKSRK